MKTIGILGGMGPEATAQLYLEIVSIFQKEYRAKYDSDFPPFFIFSLPLPDVVEGSFSEKEIIRQLCDGVKKLESMGAEVIAIACNTVQIYLPQMRSTVKVPIISLPEEVCKKVVDNGLNKVLLLGTSVTINSELYNQEAYKRGLSLIKINLEQQRELTSIIMEILSGKKSKESKEKIIKMINLYGTQAVILACTELPLLISPEDVSIKVIDTIKVLARASVDYCLGEQEKLYKG